MAHKTAQNIVIFCEMQSEAPCSSLKYTKQKDLRRDLSFIVFMLGGASRMITKHIVV
jgi:hypothetical protein